MTRYTLPADQLTSPAHGTGLRDDEQAHGARVLLHLHDELRRAGGWLDFQHFMQLALYAPGLGYYSAGAHKLGAGGDFTTAPEISPLFSRCVARQCTEVLRTLQHGSVLELGAGSGVMALDMLREFERLDCLPARYFILEVSADLRARQQALLQAQLPQHAQRVQWLDALPEAFTGVMVANEVLDALPVQRFVIEQGAPRAMGVCMGPNGLQWQTRAASSNLQTAVKNIERNLNVNFADGYCSEVNLQLPDFIQSLATSLTQGIMLFIDYGWPQAQYYAAERHQGTLSCFYRHRRHDDPLLHVGLQDITAWVDFTALAEAGVAAGLALAGFATQAHFLFGAGLQQLLSDMSEQDDAQRWRLSQQVQKLTLPAEMGESFKVMAFRKHCELELSGFSFRDLRDRL